MAAPLSPVADAAALPDAELAGSDALADAEPDAEAEAESSWSSPCAVVPLANWYSLAASGVALMPVPLVQEEGDCGAVEENWMSAHYSREQRG